MSRLVRFQIVLSTDGWTLCSPLLTVEAQMVVFPSRVRALRALRALVAYRRGEPVW